MLPIHPQPRPAEILSSWMVRLAIANGFPLHTFYANLLGFKSPIWTRDTDRHPSNALLELLARQTGQSLEALNGLALGAYEGVLFEKLPMVGNARWVLPVGVFHRTRRRAGMQFCPICLQLDSIPYFRLCWRLSIYAICQQHHCVMQEYCPSCHAPIAYHRHGIGRNKSVPDYALFLCHQCEFDLRKTSPTYFEWSDSSSWVAFVALLNDFEKGARHCGQLILPCGVIFFEGLHTLLGLVRGRNGYGLRQKIGEIFSIEIPTGFSSGHIEFEYLSAIDRLKLLLSVIWVLEDWPVRFVCLCSEVGLTRSRLDEEVQTLPFWLSSVADEYMDCRSYLPNEEEILAAGAYLLSRDKEVTLSAMRNILGLSKGIAQSAWRSWKQHYQ